jgi:hypothetical protein
LLHHSLFHGIGGRLSRFLQLLFLLLLLLFQGLCCNNLLIREVLNEKGAGCEDKSHATCCQATASTPSSLPP